MDGEAQTLEERERLLVSRIRELEGRIAAVPPNMHQELFAQLAELGFDLVVVRKQMADRDEKAALAAAPKRLELRYWFEQDPDGRWRTVIESSATSQLIYSDVPFSSRADAIADAHASVRLVPMLCAWMGVDSDLVTITYVEMQ